MQKTNRILITGASGFIGSHILRTLYEKGYRNLCSTTYSRTLRKDFYGWETVENHHGDLRTAEFCEKVSREVDVVIHCAANTSNALDTKFNPLLHVTPNIEMNTNLMEQSWKNKVKKFIFISSNTVFSVVIWSFCSVVI